MGLEKLGREPKPRFAGAGRADHTAIQVPGVGRVLGPGVHGEKFRPGENDVVLKPGIDKGLDVLFRSKPGRSIFFIVAVFLCLFAFAVDQQAEARRAHNANEPVKGMKSRRKVGKGRADGLPQTHELVGEVRARRQTVGCAHFQTRPQNEQVRHVGKNVLADVICPQPLPPFPVPGGAGAVAAPAPGHV